MRAKISVAIAILLLAACATDNGPAAVTSPAAITQSLICGEREFTVSSGADDLRLWLDREVVLLPRVPSASGSKYQAGEIMFWSKGESAMLEIGDQVFRNCRLVGQSGP